MARRLIAIVSLVLTAKAAPAGAADRFVVLEFFGRPQGAYCSAAGPAMRALQDELAGEAELLEYDYDGFPYGRVERFWASGAQASFLPLVMVGSGYQTSSGHADYYSEYSGLITLDRLREPEAEVTAFWRRVGASVRSYVTVRNTRVRRLRVDEQAAVWTVVFERARIGVSDTWVRSTTRHALAADLRTDESVDLVIDAPGASLADWNRAAVVVMVEDRPGGARYDMLQAALAEPAALALEPERVVLSPASRTVQVAIGGPHVLSWTAASEVPWLEVSPSAGEVPGTATVTYRPELRPPGELTGDVVIDAAGDGMAFSERLEVELAGQVRHGGGRRVPGP
jgi:hypothetical protein